MRVAVAGGTGTVGREIVAVARERGHETVVIARARGVDLITGAGLQDALHGADVVIDAASTATLDAKKSTEFFRTATTAVLSGARAAGARHVVVLSIVGVDRNPHGYYAGKVAQERVVMQSDAPWTIVRATQFHEFAGQIARRAKLGPVQLAPRGRIQPIAAVEVARRLVTLAEGDPVGRARDIAGPREEELADVVRAWVRHRGRTGPVLPIRLPGAQMRGMRHGLVLPGPDAERLGPTFGEWLRALPTD